MQIICRRTAGGLFCVSALNSKLTIEKLDKIYFCMQCKTVFLFKSDAEDHKEMSGHSDKKTESFK